MKFILDNWWFLLLVAGVVFMMSRKHSCCSHDEHQEKHNKPEEKGIVVQDQVPASQSNLLKVLMPMGMMVLCCALPILLLAFIPFLKTDNPAIKNVIAGITPFICPIVMGGMFLMMFKKDKHKEQ